jgi:hypothetical protein
MEKSTNDKELYAFVKGHYYSDIEENILWEPFEFWSHEDVEKQIQKDVQSLTEFMKRHREQDVEQLATHLVEMYKDVYERELATRKGTNLIEREGVTRLEIIGDEKESSPRIFSRWNIKRVRESVQDNGRTIKLFIETEEKEE